MAAPVYTMVEMAKVYCLNVYKYLKYLLEHLPEILMSDACLAKLALWAQGVTEVCSGTME
ncbi:MAG: hypothetical protein Q4F41_09850 [Eubacteriales bacterium]|nr:hypothetical protein [Eubacteriales bacterium]